MLLPFVTYVYSLFSVSEAKYTLHAELVRTIRGLDESLVPPSCAQLLSILRNCPTNDSGGLSFVLQGYAQLLELAETITSPLEWASVGGALVDQLLMLLGRLQFELTQAEQRGVASGLPSVLRLLLRCAELDASLLVTADGTALVLLGCCMLQSERTQEQQAALSVVRVTFAHLLAENAPDDDDKQADDGATSVDNDDADSSADSSVDCCVLCPLFMPLLSRLTLPAAASSLQDLEKLFDIAQAQSESGHANGRMLLSGARRGTSACANGAVVGSSSVAVSSVSAPSTLLVRILSSVGDGGQGALINGLSALRSQLTQLQLHSDGGGNSGGGGDGDGDDGGSHDASTLAGLPSFHCVAVLFQVFYCYRRERRQELVELAAAVLSLLDPLVRLRPVHAVYFVPCLLFLLNKSLALGSSGSSGTSGSSASAGSPTTERTTERLTHSLLMALAPLARHHACTKSVLRTLKPMLATPQLRPVAVRLLCRVWQRQERAFNKLVAELQLQHGDSDVLRLAQAASLHDVCITSPERGSELIGLLQKFLGDDLEGCVVLALRSIVSLCEGDCLDFFSAFRILSRPGKVAHLHPSLGGGRIDTIGNEVGQEYPAVTAAFARYAL
jgi:hypothetical protein